MDQYTAGKNQIKGRVLEWQIEHVAGKEAGHGGRASREAERVGIWLNSHQVCPFSKDLPKCGEVVTTVTTDFQNTCDLQTFQDSGKMRHARLPINLIPVGVISSEVAVPSLQLFRSGHHNNFP